MSKLNLVLVFIAASFLSNAIGSQYDEQPGQAKRNITCEQFIEAIRADPSYFEKLNQKCPELIKAILTGGEKLAGQKRAEEEERKAEEESKRFETYKSWHDTVFITFNEKGSSIDKSKNTVWEFYTPTINDTYSPKYNSTLDWEPNYTADPPFLFLDLKKPSFESCKSTHDERKRVGSPYKWPYSICGKLIINYGEVRQEEDIAIGTGTLISSYHVLTAGHNIYNPAYDDGLAREIKFLYATLTNDLPPFLEWREIKVKHAYLASRWAKKKYQPKYDECDYGLLVLEEEVGNLHIPPSNKQSDLQALTSLQENTSMLKRGLQHEFLLSTANPILSRLGIDRVPINIAGFPVEFTPPSKPLLDHNQISFPCTINTHKAHQMFMASGELAMGQRRLIHSVDTTQGQSGSLLYLLITEEGKRTYYGVGIHTKGKEGDSHPELLNKAVMITDHHFKNMMMWIDNS